MPVLHQAKVLIVDDDPEFGLVAKNLVEIEGFLARLAASGKEALAAYAEEPFDVILLDLMLGDASGLDLLRTVRSQDPLLPVIVVTAHGSIESAAEAVQAEAFDYLGKPFRAAELVGALRRALEWRGSQRTQKAEPRDQGLVMTSIVGRSPAMVAFCLVEQVERACQVALGRLEARLGAAHAIAPII